jgi:hypothetical protein
MRKILQEVHKMEAKLTLMKRRVTRRERAPKDIRRVRVPPKSPKRVSKYKNSQKLKAAVRSKPKKTCSWRMRPRSHRAMRMSQMMRMLRLRTVINNTTILRHSRESTIRPKS